MDQNHRASMACVQMIEQYLNDHGLFNCSSFFMKIVAEKPQLLPKILSLLESKEPTIRIPICFLCRTMDLEDDEMIRLEIDKIWTEIEGIKTIRESEEKKFVVFLDELLGHQKRLALCSSIPDLYRLLVILRNIPFQTLTSNLAQAASPNHFWGNILPIWIDSFLSGLSGRLTPEVVQLFLSADLSVVNGILKQLKDSEEEKTYFNELLEDLTSFQKERPFSPSDWQMVLSKRSVYSKGSAFLLHLHFIQRVVLNWLEEQDLQEGKVLTTGQKIAMVVWKLMVDCKWRFDNVKSLFRFQVKSYDHKKMLLNALNIIHDYGLNSADLEQLKEKLNAHEVRKLSKFAVSTVFTNKAVEMLIEDAILKVVEDCETEGATSITVELLRQWWDELQSCLGNMKIDVLEEVNKKMKNTKHCRSERRIMFKNGKERLAAAIFAVNSYFNCQMRPVQILALILAGKASEKSKARILQMQTGEGKTFVVAALAVSRVFEGNQVDVVTSSSELAENQWHELKAFYNSIGIEVQHNAKGRALDLFSGDAAERALIDRTRAICEGPDPGEVTSQNQVYQADVVYGAAEDFMADVLHEEFADSGVKFKRGFPVAIVDEVDSMFIDGRNDSVRLSSKSPGMGKLLGVKFRIWMQVELIFKKMRRENGKWIFISENGNNPIENNSELYDFVRNGSQEYMEKVLRFREPTPSDGDPFPHQKIPPYLQEFVKIQLPKWIDSAIEARFIMEPGFHYIVNGNQIVVVDAANTGVHHPTMQWSHGLHQFLQMKHSLEVEPEALPTNFLSNVGFFLRYKSNLIGLTGTIGGKSSRTFLRKVYGVDFVDIPPFRERRHKELLPQLFADKKTWFETIVQNEVDKLSVGRAVLLITPYIENAEKFHAAIITEMPETRERIKLYTSRSGSQVVKEEVGPGYCIVATNIAGRGTDIKISDEVEQNGGLHVLLTMLPETDRVERQNIGRTSRTGQPGTSQIIANLEDVDAKLVIDSTDANGIEPTAMSLLNSLRTGRDQMALDAIDTAIDSLYKTKRMDEALREYIAARNALLAKHKLQDKEFKRIATLSLDARFGRHLAVTQDVSKETVKKEFHMEKYPNIEDLLDDPEKATLFAQTLMPAKPKEPKFELAMKLLDKAIEMDGGCSIGALYFRGAMLLDEYRHLGEIEKLEKSIVDFEAARKNVQEQKEQWELVLQTTACDKETDLIRQVKRRIVVYESILQNISVLVGINIQEEVNFIENHLATATGDAKLGLKNRRKVLEENREELEKGVLGSASIKMSEIAINPKDLEKSLPDGQIVAEYKKEIDDFRAEGMGLLIVVNERDAINWWIIGTIVGLATLQIVSGASAVVFGVGVGAAVGYTLMQEGVNDFIFAINKGIIERNLNLVAYLLLKVVSLGLTYFSTGMEAMKKAAAGISKGAKGAIQIFRGSAERVTVEGWKLAIHASAEVAVKNIFAVCSTRTLDVMVSKKISILLENNLNRQMEKVLRSILVKDTNLSTLLAWDRKNGNNKYEEKITQAVLNSLKSDLSFWKDLANTLKGVDTSKWDWNKTADNCVKLLKRADLALLLKNTKNFLELGQMLQEMVDSNRAEEERNASSQCVSKVPHLTPSGFLKKLSKKVCAALAPLVVTTMINVSVGKAVIYASNKFINLNGKIESYREKYVDSSDVCEKADALLKLTAADEKNKKKAIEYVKEIANEGTEDMRQLKYLAEVVDQPIQIEGKDAVGNVKITTVGESSNSPIKLIYRCPKAGEKTGIYCVPQENGEFSSLFDAISKATNYDSSCLRKATANTMLKDPDRLTLDFENNQHADIIFADRQILPQRQTKSSIEPEVFSEVQQQEGTCKNDVDLLKETEITQDPVADACVPQKILAVNADILRNKVNAASISIGNLSTELSSSRIPFHKTPVGEFRVSLEETISSEASTSLVQA